MDSQITSLQVGVRNLRRVSNLVCYAESTIKVISVTHHVVTGRCQELRGVIYYVTITDRCQELTCSHTYVRSLLLCAKNLWAVVRDIITVKS